ncbi:MAG: GtrA family protein [Candidatus Cloacimonetes bacterium]|nr:GtrA family protein [Candidatus Cloacimonadota bacterium]
MKKSSIIAKLREIGLKKFIIFQGVAWLGTLVHLGVLWLAHGVMDVPLMIAGFIAIEVAIIHNFTWHYFLTWKASITPSFKNFMLLLAKYNVVTASIDLVVNLGILWLLTKFLGVHYLVADIIGQLVGPFFKLLANEYLVFPKLHGKKTSMPDEKEIREKV